MGSEAVTDFGRRLGDMFKSDYDTNDNAVVDNASKLAGSTKGEVQNHTPKSHTHLEAHILDLDHDAGKIQGTTVDPAAIADGKALTYQSASGKVEYITPAGGAPADAIRGDGTANRYLRTAWLKIENGTNDQTLKCELIDRWNGDTIASTDNIAKNATTGHFTLSSTGVLLHIEAAGLSGNVVGGIASLYSNNSGQDLTVNFVPDSNDIRLDLRSSPGGVPLDITGLADGGQISINLLYITHA